VNLVLKIDGKDLDLMSDTTSTDSGASTASKSKASDSKASDSTSSNSGTGSIDPERQKRVTSDYRDGWATIWGKKKKKR
jgi:hypothetical protein